MFKNNNIKKLLNKENKVPERIKKFVKEGKIKKIKEQEEEKKKQLKMKKKDKKKKK